MRNIWRIFRSDWQRLTASVVAVVVVMGLCLIPCLYAWFNIFSNLGPLWPGLHLQHPGSRYQRGRGL